MAPLRAGGRDITWAWDGGVRNASGMSLGGGGVLGLLALSVVAGLVSGVAEALGMSLSYPTITELDTDILPDLGSLDDNLTLPIISGGCILGFMKLIGMATSWFSSS